MPRLARLDAVGLLQHVMVRGIEKSDIFLDDRDRSRFLEHFSELLIKTDTACLAWCLMTNHFHLLLRPQKGKLSFFMRRLLTSYAVGFNLRHHRVGHVFQNRYKSIVCEEEPYLLELVRYIHLNPLRAGFVHDRDSLENYRWSGHQVLLGKADFAGQAISEVLSRFGSDYASARERYRRFIFEAADSGGKDDLGIGRGITTPLIFAANPREEASDSRVLGSGEFVEQLWDSQDEDVPEPKMSLDSLLKEVASACGVEQEAISASIRTRKVSEARSVMCYLAIRVLGYSGVVVSRRLGITPAGVTIAAARGEALATTDRYRNLVMNIRILTS